MPSSESPAPTYMSVTAATIDGAMFDGAMFDGATGGGPWSDGCAPDGSGGSALMADLHSARDHQTPRRARRRCYADRDLVRWQSDRDPRPDRPGTGGRHP